MPGGGDVTLAALMRPVILGCFFLSGASGLVLEMLWTRLLTLVFGSTTLAVSTVLTAFMGGLGLVPNPVTVDGLVTTDLLPK